MPITPPQWKPAATLWLTHTTSFPVAQNYKTNCEQNSSSLSLCSNIPALWMMVMNFYYHQLKTSILWKPERWLEASPD